MNKKRDITPTNAEGELHGLCIFYNSNDNISSKQRYVNGINHGICESYWSDGELWLKHIRLKINVFINQPS